MKPIFTLHELLHSAAMILEAHGADRLAENIRRQTERYIPDVPLSNYIEIENHSDLRPQGDYERELADLRISYNAERATVEALVEDKKRLERENRELRDILSAVYSGWALHGIAPALEERIIAALKEKP
jgi:hypothetical protein